MAIAAAAVGRPGPLALAPALSLVAALVLARGATQLHAQTADPRTDDTGFPFRTPAASATEPAVRLGPLHTSRGNDDRWIAEVDLGERIPFWIRRDRASPFRLAGTVVGGMFSRFDLERSNNEFIEVHFRLALQLRARLGELAARAELYHASSHLGDEFLQRTGRESVSTSREGIELLLQGEGLPGLLVYAGPGVLLRRSESLDRLSARLGFEWRGRGIRGGPFLPFFAADAFLWEELGWNPIFASEAGLAFGGGRYRVAVVFGAGRSRAEQFFRESEVLAGILFTVVR
ncbi:MAG: DUF1207 domain-containing protein [Gemmatimonadota bacterium]